MEPEGFLPSLLEPTAGLYLKADESSPTLSTLIPWGLFHYYPAIYTQVFRAVSFLQVFRRKFCMHFSFFPCVLHDPIIATFPIRCPNNIYWNVEVLKPLVM
jgi:hypothetical protein